MKESKITLDEVSEIAQKLEDQGEKPTSRKILAEIGHGSMSTILKLLQQWQNNKITPKLQNDRTLDTNIVKAINTALASQIQQETSSLTTKLADLQVELDSLINENERHVSIIESQNTDLNEMRAEYSTLSGRLQQLEQQASRITADLTAERQVIQAVNMTLAQTEVRLEDLPKIEAENLKLRTENETIRIKVAEIMQSEAVALTKLEQAQQSEIEAREATFNSNKTIEVLREKYEQLQESAIDKERAIAKILEGERLASQALKFKNDTVMLELITAQNQAKEARAALEKALRDSTKSSDPHNITKINNTDLNILDFNQTETVERNELEVLDII